jgi:large repetitive protein
LKTTLTLAFKHLCVFIAALCISAGAIAQTCIPTFLTPATNTTVSCGEALPSFEECNAVSDCCSLVEEDLFVSETGQPLTNCVLSTAFGPGPDWAFWLPGVVPSNVSWHFVGDGHFETYADGTAHLWGIIQSAAISSYQFEAHIWLRNERNWAEWSALGRGYKDDLSIAATAHTEWSYYEIAEGFAYLEGIGALEGSHLQLSHKPENYYFGFQVGNAANNKNANSGMSGWFFYNGTFNGNSISGIGDVNVDNACSNVENGCTLEGYTHVCRAENECGGIAYRTQTIHSVDQELPMVTGSNAITLNCFETDGVFIEAADACSDVTITYTDTEIEPGCNGALMRVYSVTDECGNTTTFDQSIALTGGDAPVFITFPGNVTVECSQIPEPQASDVTFEEGCENTVLTITTDLIPGSCATSYTLLHIYTLTDDCGNEVSQTRIVTVEDTTAPVLFGIPEDTTLQCGDSIPDAIVFAIDNCENFVGVGLSAQTVSTGCGYNFIRTWFAQDECGNAVSVSQTITVLDNEPPVFVFVPENRTFDCESELTSDVLAEDECSSVEVTFEDFPVDGGCGPDFIRVFTATDGCGNTATAQQTWTFEDTLAPVFTAVPENLQLTCEEETEAEPSSVQFTDNCSDVTLSISDERIDGLCPFSYTIERTYTITDACSNATVHVQTITVSDNEAPVFVSELADFEIACDAPLPNNTPLVTDNCSEIVEVSMQETESELDCGSLITRTWFAIDACGNTAERVQLITRTDTVAPAFEPFENQVSLACGASAPDQLLLATDNCSSPTVTFTDMAHTAGCLGGFTRTYTATDACGNTTEAFVNFLYTDTEAPQIIQFPTSIVLQCGEPIPSPEEAVIEVTDACSAVETTFIETVFNGSCPDEQLIRRAYIFVDACENAVAALWEITIVDTIGPVLENIPQDITIGCGDPIPPVVLPTAIDACAGEKPVFVAENTFPGNCGTDYVIQRVFRSFDDCGNSGLGVQNIFVTDTDAPLISGPSFVVRNCGEEQGIFVEAEDECNSVASVAYADSVIINPSCANSLLRTYFATDICGNISEFEQIISIVDNVDPVITAFPNDTLLSCEEIPSFEDSDVAFFDACSDVSFTAVDEIIPGLCDSDYILERVFTISDACGNTVSRTWTVQVADNSAPTIFGVPEDVTLPCSAGTPEVSIFALDNCSAFPNIILSATTTPTDCGFSFTRTWLAVDDCGNVSEANQTILFEDTEAPVLSDAPGNLVLPCGAEIPLVPTITATDDCAGEIPVSFEETTTGNGCDEVITRTWCAFDCTGAFTCVSQQISFLPQEDDQLIIQWQNEEAVSLRFALTETNYVQVKLLNASGAVVRELFAGVASDNENYTFEFAQDGLASGVYLVQLISGATVDTERIVFAR